MSLIECPVDGDGLVVRSRGQVELAGGGEDPAQVGVSTGQPILVFEHLGVMPGKTFVVATADSLWARASEFLPRMEKNSAQVALSLGQECGAFADGRVGLGGDFIGELFVELAGLGEQAFAEDG